MAFKIYTKTGDKGMTSLYGGTKVSKDNIRIEAYGTVDELNSFLGYLHSKLLNKKEFEIIEEIQKRLFTIGATLAVDPDKNKQVPDLSEDDVILLEKNIDRLELSLDPLKTFILPSGDEAVGLCHICRTICRRAERRVVSLQLNSPKIDLLVIKYLNRLSDYLFVLARFVAKINQIDEIPWIPRK